MGEDGPGGLEGIHLQVYSPIAREINTVRLPSMQSLQETYYRPAIAVLISAIVGGLYGLT
jgi:hypothetical protein